MRPNSPPTEPPTAAARLSTADDDEAALARYRYLLRTASPEWIEQAHTKAIEALTAAQQHLLLRQVGEMLPPSERRLAGPANATPHGIARLITRAELQRPGQVERTLGAAAVADAGGGLHLRDVAVVSLLAGLVGGVVGSAVGVVAGSAIIGMSFDGEAQPAADADVPDTTADGGLFLPDDDDGFGLGGLFDV